MANTKKTTKPVEKSNKTKKTASAKAPAKKTTTAKNKIQTAKPTAKTAAQKPAATAHVPESPKVKRTGSYPELIDTRLTQIRFRFSELKVDGLVVNYLPNIRYLTNFSGSSATLIIFDDEIYFFTDDRYEEQIKTELYPLPNMKTFITRDFWEYSLQNNLLKHIDSLGFEGDRIAYSVAVETRNRIRPLKYKPTENYEVERYTMPKAPEELANIKEACRLAEETYKKILKYIKPGAEEKMIANEISYLARKLGSEGDAFDIIVTSGARGALVHGTPSDKKIKLGDIVIMDFGCKVNGFCSDITRTVAVGKATKEQREIYKLLYNAKEKAIMEVRPHMSGKHLDLIARDMIQEAGFGQYFQHSLGHGLGLVVHENPIISFRLDSHIIPEDVVLAIEPGVYFPNKYGMRVEDNIFVKREGAVRLTNAPEELPIIPVK